MLRADDSQATAVRQIRPEETARAVLHWGRILQLSTLHGGSLQRGKEYGTDRDAMGSGVSMRNPESQFEPLWEPLPIKFELRPRSRVLSSLSKEIEQQGPYSCSVDANVL